MNTGNIEWTYNVESKQGSYLFTDKVAFTKEQLYESFRKEIETLIPEDLHNYL